MKFDIFFSICQTEVDGYLPSERVMWENFFDQVHLADQLKFGTAWVAETHLSCQVQKQNPGAVIPHFKGEIGLNTDILQLAHKVFAQTKNLNVGSAIMNIQCNGGPIAHAERIKTFLSLHDMTPGENRILDIGFASGRFPFSNIPYGVHPRTATEKEAWPALKGKVFMEATEIFLRFLKGEIFSSEQVTKKVLTREDFRSDEDWDNVRRAYAAESGENINSIKEIGFAPFWNFPKVGVIPFETSLEHLRLTIGAHWAGVQHFANTILPVGVFNLSITPNDQIEKTHERMKKHFHADGGEWSRDRMPRTVLVFINNEAQLSREEKREKARKAAVSATENYWKAIQGTLDPAKITNAVDNALVGSPEDIVEQMKERFNPGDRLMLWFDFNNHNNENVKQMMKDFMEFVAPEFS